MCLHMLKMSNVYPSDYHYLARELNSEIILVFFTKILDFFGQNMDFINNEGFVEGFGLIC